jgi:hypothetical protein
LAIPWVLTLIRFTLAAILPLSWRPLAVQERTIIFVALVIQVGRVKVAKLEPTKIKIAIEVIKDSLSLGLHCEILVKPGRLCHFISLKN